MKIKTSQSFDWHSSYADCSILRNTDVGLLPIKLNRHCIYQAEAILKDKSVNPPSIETLARQVGTNRFKLNQGFQQIYGATPYEYVKHCRLWQAKRLLMTSELSIEEVVATVGYKSRSRFATAFRQHFGINPKAFQIQAWQCAS